MAAPLATHPGPSGGQRHDEFTADELLEAMFRRKKQEEDIAAFKEKAMATPQQYTDWQNEQDYAQANEESDTLAQLQELRGRRDERIQEMQESMFQRGAELGARAGATARPEEVDRMQAGSYEDLPFGPVRNKPRVYTHDELIEASDGRLTAQSLKAMEVFEKLIVDRKWAKQQGHKVGEWPEKEFQKYMRSIRLREFAQLKILGRIIPGAPLSARYREFEE